MNKNDTSRNVILERYLRIGDRVEMNMDSEARGWGRKNVPDGTLGTVCQANTYLNYRGRIHEFGRKPGVYRANGGFTVEWDNGERNVPGAGDIRWVDETLNDVRRQDREANEKFETDVFLHNLPKTIGIYEYDIVEITDPRARAAFGATYAKVERIDWHQLDRKRNDGSPMPIFNCGYLEENRGRMAFDVTEVKLHQRGIVWMWYTGKRADIVFASFEEELHFHNAMGMRQQIRCPQTGNYHWPIDAVLPAAKEGLIDVLSNQPGFFGASGIMAAYKFDDKDLSERCRKKLIEGFSQGL